MGSIAYETMLEQITKEDSPYTEVTAKNRIAKLYASNQLSDDEYDDLMEKASSLNVNSEDGELNIRFTALERKVSDLEQKVNALMDETGTEDPSEGQPKPDGTEYNPIEAYRGMEYFKDKYYKDAEDSKVYLCTRDSDTDPGTGVSLNYLPHELEGIYFQYVRMG